MEQKWIVTKNFHCSVWRTTGDPSSSELRNRWIWPSQFRQLTNFTFSFDELHFSWWNPSKKESDVSFHLDNIGVDEKWFWHRFHFQPESKKAFLSQSYREFCFFFYFSRLLLQHHSQLLNVLLRLRKCYSYKYPTRMLLMFLYLWCRVIFKF